MRAQQRLPGSGLVKGLLIVAVAGLGVGFLLGRRGFPRTLDEADALREAIEERELMRATFAYGAQVESAA